ncbi:MAG: exo-alpha-sialidase [Rhodobacteraceae bacterium]|nr:exo-alpha-sialidase [Paracoccaceae bacterium]
MAAAVTVLVGTTKGAFLIEGDPRRSGWKVRGPLCGGWPINHVVGDPGTGRIWAGGGSEWHGAGVWRSADGGDSWNCAKLTSGQMDDWAANDPDFARMIGWTPGAPPFGRDFQQVWSLNFAHGVLHAGTKPAALLASRDGGETWERVEGLTDHPSRPGWNGGAAGLVLHSIVPDPGDSGKLWVGISAAGVFATEDGGRSWDRRNRLSNAEAHAHHDHPAAPKDGETGHCVHNLVRAPGRDGDLLYQQNHHGVFRSADGGRSWDDVTAGLPSTFGFPIAVHPRDPGTIWTLPLNGDIQGRFPPEASAAVWKSTDGGASWARKQAGLPERDCFFTVLRQGMAVDGADPAGVYFGTNSGSVFASRDEGETWDEIARHLPTVLSVETLTRA